MCSVLNVVGGVSSPNVIWWNTLCYHTTCSYNCSFSNCDAITYCGVATNKCILFNMNIPQSVMSPFLIRVKEMCEYGSTLCDSNSFFYCNKIWRNGVKVNIFINIAWLFYIYPPPFDELVSLVTLQW